MPFLDHLTHLERHLLSIDDRQRDLICQLKWLAIKGQLSDPGVGVTITQSCSEGSFTKCIKTFGAIRKLVKAQVARRNVE